MTDKQKKLIDDIQALAKQLGKTPNREEFGKRSPVNINFGGFSNLLKAAGLEQHPNNVRAEEVPLPIEISKEITAPPILNDDISIDELIELKQKRFTKKNTAYEAQKWAEYKVDTDKPIAICWFGDPHLDDDGCHWPQLLEDIELCKTTPGMYGANIGDVHNNWVGRLTSEYASQSSTRSEALRLIEWFAFESGVSWLLWLMGNHDTWNFGGETIAQIVKHRIPMKDWRAQFKLVFANGCEVLIDAAHDHSGHSQWNSLHGQQKASVMGGIAHLYIGGHKHNWAIAQNECPFTHRIYHLARVRGYKFIDSYGDKLGFGSQNNGSSIVSVIDPTAHELNRIRLFADVKEAAEYLTYLRNRIK